MAYSVTRLHRNSRGHWSSAELRGRSNPYSGPDVAKRGNPPTCNLFRWHIFGTGYGCTTCIFDKHSPIARGTRAQSSWPILSRQSDQSAFCANGKPGRLQCHGEARGHLNGLPSTDPEISKNGSHPPKLNADRS